MQPTWMSRVSRVHPEHIERVPEVQAGRCHGEQHLVRRQDHIPAAGGLVTHGLSCSLYNPDPRTPVSTAGTTIGERIVDGPGRPTAWTSHVRAADITHLEKETAVRLSSDPAWRLRIWHSSRSATGSDCLSRRGSAIAPERVVWATKLPGTGMLVSVAVGGAELCRRCGCTASVIWTAMRC